MAAPVVAHIHDQGVSVHFSEIEAVELGITVGAHIRDVDIANLASGFLVHISAIRFDPLAIADTRCYLGEKVRSERYLRGMRFPRRSVSLMLRVCRWERGEVKHTW